MERGHNVRSGGRCVHDVIHFMCGVRSRFGVYGYGGHTVLVARGTKFNVQQFYQCLLLIQSASQVFALVLLSSAGPRDFMCDTSVSYIRTAAFRDLGWDEMWLHGRSCRVLQLRALLSAEGPRVCAAAQPCNPPCLFSSRVTT